MRRKATGYSLLLIGSILAGFLRSHSALAADRPYTQERFIPWVVMFDQRLHEYFPMEMANYLDSYRTCQHWGGEEANDPQRRGEIQKGVAASCIDFVAAEKAIEEKYRNDLKFEAMKKMKGELDKGESMRYSFLWDDPGKQSLVLNKYTESEAQNILKNVQEQMREFDLLEAGKADSVKMTAVRYRLRVQKDNLNAVLPETDRLHPVTRKEIDALRNNKLFLQRASRQEDLGNDPR